MASSELATGQRRDELGQKLAVSKTLALKVNAPLRADEVAFTMTITSGFSRRAFMNRT